MDLNIEYQSMFYIVILTVCNMIMLLLMYFCFLYIILFKSYWVVSGCDCLPILGIFTFGASAKVYPGASVIRFEVMSQFIFIEGGYMLFDNQRVVNGF